MLTNTQVKLLRRLLEPDKPSETRLAKELGLTQGTVSIALKKLRAEGLLENNREWARTPHALALKKVFAQNPGADSYEFLQDACLEVLAHLAKQPGTAKEIAEATGYSLPRVFQALKIARERWAIGPGKRFTLSRLRPDFNDFLTAWNARPPAGLKLPDLALLYWHSEDEAVFGLPTYVKPEKGTPTGHSRFTESDLALLSNQTWYAVKKNARGEWEPFPENELTPTKILEHARFVAKDWREKGFCVLYYVKNRAKLPENPDFERILRGESVEGWPLLKDLADMADVYEVKLPRPEAR